MIELINQAGIINHTQQFLHILRPLVNHQSVHDYFATVDFGHNVNWFYTTY